jgi:hypothetical protein
VELGPGPAAPAGVTETPEETGFVIVEEEPTLSPEASMPLGTMSAALAAASRLDADAVMLGIETSAAIVEKRVAIDETSARVEGASRTSLDQEDAVVAASFSSQAQAPAASKPSAPAGGDAAKRATVAGSKTTAKRGTKERSAPDSFWRFGK